MPLENELPAALQPWSTPHLILYAQAIGRMFAESEAFSEDTEDQEGYITLLDPVLAPLGALRYQAMIAGERMPQGLSEALQREYITDAPNHRRGTLMSLVRAAQRTLIGQRTVSITESSPNTDTIQVVTYTSETPYPASVLNDLLSVVPADIILNYQVLSSSTYTAAMTGYASYAAMDVAYTTYQDMRDSLSGYTAWTRPLP